MRARITGLQEAQVPELVRIDALCSELYYAIGFDGAEVPARTELDFGLLARQNRVRVLEADDVVVGFVAWHDESPGVALLADIQVDPAHHRAGFGTKLLRAMREDARSLGFDEVVVRAWSRATWAVGFYARHGFDAIEADAPAKVAGWRDERLAVKALARPGEIALWSSTATA